MRSSSLAALLGIAILPLGGLLLGFSKGPLPGLSGGFQESTCVSCHNSFSLNEGRGLGGIFTSPVYRKRIVLEQPIPSP